MKKEEFNLYLNKRLSEIKNTLESKGSEYADDSNVFKNFEAAADIVGDVKEKVMFNYLLKHLVSVMDIVDKPDRYEYLSEELIREKFGDLINYFIILETSLLERLEK